jgi:hypothetical protein
MEVITSSIMGAIKQHPFACLLIILDLCSVGWYATEPHYGRMLYWVCAAGITAAATFGME